MIALTETDDRALLRRLALALSSAEHERRYTFAVFGTLVFVTDGERIAFGLAADSRSIAQRARRLAR